MLAFGLLGQTDRPLGRYLLIALALFHRLEVAPLGGLMPGRALQAGQGLASRKRSAELDAPLIRTSAANERNELDEGFLTAGNVALGDLERPSAFTLSTPEIPDARVSLFQRIPTMCQSRQLGFSNYLQISSYLKAL